MVKGGDKFMDRITSIKFGLLLFTCTLAGKPITAQDSVWTLQRSVAYAKTNNLSIQQSVLNERVAKMQWEQSRLSVLPDISMSSSYGRNFGRSIDPTTNTFNSTVYDFTGLNGSASVLLFGWFRTRNTITKNDLLHRVSETDLSQLQNDIALNATTGYLRTLLAKEQISISLYQLDISNKQVKQTESLLAAGRSNGLDVAQVKTQLIVDSSNFFKAQLALQQAMIDMKALLNLPFNDSFETQPITEVNLNESLLILEPEQIYNEAESQFGTIKSAELKILSAEKDLALAKSSLYPQVNFSASSGTNYSSTYHESLPDGQMQVMPWGKQLQNNFSQSIYLGLSIPIFNGLSSRYGVKQAKTSIQINKLQSSEAKLKLRQDIYKACNEVSTAFQTFRASKSAVNMAQTGLDFAQKRYEKGLIPAIDLLLAQNTAFKANANVASSKYDLLFKLIVIDYYLGRNLFE
jgi:outer membrane protein